MKTIRQTLEEAIEGKLVGRNVSQRFSWANGIMTRVIKVKRVCYDGRYQWRLEGPIVKPTELDTMDNGEDFVYYMGFPDIIRLADAGYCDVDFYHSSLMKTIDIYRVENDKEEQQ